MIILEKRLKGVSVCRIIISVLRFASLSKRENSREATREINRQKPCDVKDKLRKEFPVAMAYVPWQRYLEPYPVCKGFIRGTIF